MRNPEESISLPPQVGDCRVVALEIRKKIRKEMMDAEEQIWTLTRGEPRSVYSLEAVTVRAEDINDATEQRPSITSPSSVPSLFPLYRKYRLRLGKPLSFVLVFYNARATPRFLNRASSFYALIVLLHSRSRVEFWWTTVDTHYAKVVIDKKEEKKKEKKKKRVSVCLSVESLLCSLHREIKVKLK